MSEMVSIPYAVYESQQERNDRAHRRLWIIVIILVIALLGTNIAWLAYESQFETVTSDTDSTVISVAQENSGEGDNYFIGNNGDINGEADDIDCQDAH